MKILFISSWPIKSGLTQNTVIPNIGLLEKMEIITSITIATLEENCSDKNAFDLENETKTNQYFEIKWRNKNVIFKVYDFYTGVYRLIRLIRAQKFDVIICRGVTSGNFGLLANLFTGAKLIVESFEPHHEYMLQSTFWKKYGLKYWVQRLLSNCQIRRSVGILTVTEKYRQILISEKINPDKIAVAPCWIDLTRFNYDPAKRFSLRKDLGISENIVVGIHTGKFGGMYLDKEAFELFGKIKLKLPSFFLILLTNTNHSYLHSQLLKNGFSTGEFLIKTVSADEVPFYLNASDVAFSLVNESPVMLNSCVVKIAEYVANGLPVFYTRNSGEDSAWLKEYSLGKDFSTSDAFVLNSFLHLIKKERTGINEKGLDFLVKNRNRNQTINSYNIFLRKHLYN